jgi:hypothetical protein
MAYLHCGRCGLEIRIQATYLTIDNCPRCVARNATVVPMRLSSSRVASTGGRGSRAAGLPSDPRDRRQRSARPATDAAWQESPCV